MKKNQRILRGWCAFLTVLMIVSTAACTHENENRLTDETTAQSEETSERLWLDDLPDMMDFNSMTIVCDYYDPSLYTGNPDGTTEVVGKAGFQKDRRVL